MRVQYIQSISSGVGAFSIMAENETDRTIISQFVRALEKGQIFYQGSTYECDYRATTSFQIGIKQTAINPTNFENGGVYMCLNDQWQKIGEYHRPTFEEQMKMFLAEVDPNKKYFLFVDDYKADKNTLDQMSHYLKENGYNNVHVVMGDVQLMESKTEKFFGLYCEQCNAWYRRTDNSLLNYPSAELAAADLSEIQNRTFDLSHSYQVTEVGKEKHIPYEELGDRTLCPTLAGRGRYEYKG